ncbi:MAG: phosphoribosylglycinamide formyltransferase, partial [Solirubrobacterales bacterium]
PIILQAPVELSYTRDRDEIEREIHRTEHELLPKAIELIAAGHTRFDPQNARVVMIDEHGAG